MIRSLSTSLQLKKDTKHISRLTRSSTDLGTQCLLRSTFSMLSLSSLTQMTPSAILIRTLTPSFSPHVHPGSAVAWLSSTLEMSPFSINMVIQQIQQSASLSRFLIPSLVGSTRLSSPGTPTGTTLGSSGSGSTRGKSYLCRRISIMNPTSLATQWMESSLWGLRMAANFSLCHLTLTSSISVPTTLYEAKMQPDSLHKEGQRSASLYQRRTLLRQPWQLRLDIKESSCHSLQRYRWWDQRT